MSARSRRSRAPRASSDTSPGREEAPSWSLPLTASNSEQLAMITGQQVDEAEATSVLARITGQQAPEAAGRPVPEGILGEALVDHDARVRDMALTRDTSLELFRQRWAAHRDRYERVAAQAGVPAVLIAAIHFRESSMDFSTYLHQGDPLGRPAVNHPANIPVFHDWEEAAIHALNLKRGIASDLGMEAETDDLAAMAAYSEAYNGFGYRYRGKPSAYVYASTDQYEGGRYVADGVFDPNSWDQRPGTMALVLAAGEGEVSEAPLRAQTEEEAWQALVSGGQTARRGQRGVAVRAVQERLVEAGYGLVVDGDFGGRTHAAVVDFQRNRGLKVDGVVGRATAEALEGSPVARSEDSGVWQAVLAGNLYVRRGDVGESVRELQERLVEAGYGLVVDGDFGPLTLKAVREFQAAQGLQVDGVVGPQTAARL